MSGMAPPPRHSCFLPSLLFHSPCALSRVPVHTFLNFVFFLCFVFIKDFRSHYGVLFRFFSLGFIVTLFRLDPPMKYFSVCVKTQTTMFPFTFIKTCASHWRYRVWTFNLVVLPDINSRTDADAVDGDGDHINQVKWKMPLCNLLFDRFRFIRHNKWVCCSVVE